MHERSGWMCLLCVKFILNIFFHHSRSRFWEIRRRSECFGTFVIISTNPINWSQMKRLAFFPDFVRSMHADEAGGGTSCPLNGFLAIWWGYLIGVSSLTKKFHNPHTWQHLKNETQIPIMWDNLQGRPLLYQPWTWMKVRKWYIFYVQKQDLILVDCGNHRKYLALDYLPLFFKLDSLEEYWHLYTWSHFNRCAC
jgi:hypothetical protein